MASPGWRSDFLTAMGFAIADTGGDAIARDRIAGVLGGADALIWLTESDDERTALLADPEVAKVQRHSVFTDKDLAGAIAFASPLSYPPVADQLPARIASVTG